MIDKNNGELDKYHVNIVFSTFNVDRWVLYFHLKRCNIKRTTCVKDTAAGVAAVTGILSVFCTPTTESTTGNLAAANSDIHVPAGTIAANYASATILRDVTNVATANGKKK